MEYMPTPAYQTVGFVYSAGLGFCLGLVYDFFRIIFYLLTGSDKKLMTLRDIIYSLVCLIVNFLFLLVMCSGRVMLYVFAGEGIGMYIYFLTLSDTVFRPSKAVLKGIRKSAVKIRKFFNSLYLKILTFFQNICKKVKKSEKNC